jgi:RNA polymerase sigma factor (TIGR02999 family)
MQPTALIHELYLRLSKMSEGHFDNRQRFLGLAARIMRQILTDHARRLSRAKRGGKPVKVTLGEALQSSNSYPDEYLMLDEALTKLAAMSQLHAQVIELRYFVGLTTDEVAEALAISRTTVNRTQRMAEAWLNGILNGKHPEVSL